MKLLDLVQNTPEWEEYRRSHIGASDIPILMEGSDREIYDLMQVKRGLKQVFVTEAMKRGSEMEAEAVEWLVGYRPKDKICALHEKENWLMASFDYLRGSLLLEVKCPTHVFDTIEEHSHYKRWWWQVQAQLAVEGRLKEAVLLAYSPLEQVKSTIHRDEVAIARLIESGRAFYEKMVNFVELPKPGEAELREDETALEWAEEFKRAHEQAKEAKEKLDVLRDEGIAISRDEPFVCNGVRVTRIANKETIDYEAACRAHQIDVSKFVKAPKSPYTWRLSIS